MTVACTPGSMNNLFSDLFKEFWERYFKGCSGLFRGDVGRFLEEISKENGGQLYPEKTKA